MSGDGLANLGVRLMYDPVEYAHEEFRHTRWEMIRPFKENRYFKEVHKSLNGVVAYLDHARNDSNPQRKRRRDWSSRLPLSLCCYLDA